VLAAVLDAPKSVRLTTREVPTPGDDEIVLRVAACGICGTDIHIVDGEFPVPFPLVPGHEFAGEVIAVGAEVVNVRPGDRVGVDPALSCGHCEFCRRGRRNLCVVRGAIGGTVDGAFAEFVRAPSRNAYVLPSNLAFTDAALIEPVSCVVHGFQMLAPRLGDSFLVFGAGTTGLMFVQLALRSGSSRVAVVNRSEGRLAAPQKLGAHGSTDVRDVLLDEPLGFDCVVDSTGVPSVIEAAVRATKPGGKLLLFGVAPERAAISVSPFRIFRDEITIMGSAGILYAYAPALDLLEAGALDTSMLLTHAYGLAEFETALQTVRDGDGVKVQIVSA
jgi:2-desacetyl-2-hydroxyethyl bacteriochlorophyllide A dehydrogenase